MFRRPVLRLLMDLSDTPLLGSAAVRLAGRLVGPYKDRWILASLSGKPYVSPKSQVRGRDIRISPGVFVDDFVTIYVHRDGGSISLGQGTKVYRGTIIESGQGGNIQVGQDSHIQASCDLKGFLNDLTIGSKVNIGPHCCFSSYNHRFEDPILPIAAQGLVSKGDTVVEDDAWLGAGVTVLDGVRIGRGVVVGAGSVVTGDLPARSICVGVPARVVGWRGGREVASLTEKIN